MVRIVWRRVAVGAFLGGAALLGGSSLAPAEPTSPTAAGQKVVLKEEGRAARTCVIEKSTPLPTGSVVHQVRDVDTGATFTILDQRQPAKPSLIGRLFSRASDATPAVTMTPAAPPLNFVKTDEVAALQPVIVAEPVRPEPPQADLAKADPLLAPPGRLPGEAGAEPAPPGTPAGRWKDFTAPEAPPARAVASWVDTGPLSVPGQPSSGMMSVLSRVRLGRATEAPAPTASIIPVSHTQPAMASPSPLAGDAWNQAFLLLVLREALGPTEREQAARLLAGGPRRDAPETTAALFRTAQEDPSPAVRACCVRCLGALNQLQQPANHAAVQRLAKDPDSRVTEELHRAMGQVVPR